eukprot:3793230-Prymnesium_polylepis.1
MKPVVPNLQAYMRSSQSWRSSATKQRTLQSKAVAGEEGGGIVGLSSKPPKFLLVLRNEFYALDYVSSRHVGQVEHDDRQACVNALRSDEPREIEERPMQRVGCIFALEPSFYDAGGARSLLWALDSFAVAVDSPGRS